MYFCHLPLKMKNLLGRLGTKNILISAGIGILILVLLSFLTFQWFNIYTRHGKTVKVPDLTGMSMDEAQKVLKSQGLKMEIKDSIAEIKEKSLKDIAIGGVLGQNPAAGEDVKPGRKIYLVVRAKNPVMVAMPNLIDLPFSNALEILEDYGLKMGAKTEKPGPPPVMQQLHKGKPIKPGTMIAKGSKIDLVVGRGDSEVMVSIPNVVGLTRKRAIEVLSNAGLNLGAENPMPDDEEGSSWIVSRQSPTASDGPSVSEGSDVDLWYER